MYLGSGTGRAAYIRANDQRASAAGAAGSLIAVDAYNHSSRIRFTCFLNPKNVTFMVFKWRLKKLKT